MYKKGINKPDIFMNKPLCIGIGGVSRSGKTFLSGILKNVFENSVVIHQDTFVPDEQQIPKIKDHIDWERPEAIDWQSFRHAIVSAIQSGNIVIVEGLFTFNNHEINKLYNKTIFITLSKDEFLTRKNKDLRWGREPIWYINHIWESYLQYGLLPEELANSLKVNGEVDFDLQNILTYLRTNT
jgi:nicotinamide/nicotinate riboside kinase